MLKDDKQFYPSYMCGNVVRNDILRKHPEIEEVLSRLDGIITDEAMAKMNYEVESLEMEPRDVAKKYLKSIGLTE